MNSYTEKASSDFTPSKKIEIFNSIISPVKTSMLTSRNKDGFLHSRAMSPAFKENNLDFYYIANIHSGKTSELENDSHVNISYYDYSTTNWASVAGKATVTQDQQVINKVWNPSLKAWFGDLGDGKHTGEKTDPRIMVIIVKPQSIHFWHSTRTTIGAAYEIVKSTVTGEVAAPGDLVEITPEELKLIQSLSK